MLFYGWYSNRMREYRKQHGLAGDAGVAQSPAGADRVRLDVRRSAEPAPRRLAEAHAKPSGRLA